MYIVMILLALYITTVVISYGFLFSYFQCFEPLRSKSDYYKDMKSSLKLSLKGPITLNYIITNGYHKHGLKFW